MTASGCYVLHSPALDIYSPSLGQWLMGNSNRVICEPYFITPSSLISFPELSICSVSSAGVLQSAWSLFSCVLLWYLFQSRELTLIWGLPLYVFFSPVIKVLHNFKLSQNLKWLLHNMFSFIVFSRIEGYFGTSHSIINRNWRFLASLCFNTFDFQVLLSLLLIFLLKKIKKC